MGHTGGPVPPVASHTMSLRLYVESPLSAGLEFGLPEDAARHVQVRRLQPGDELRLFDGAGGEWARRGRAHGQARRGRAVGARAAVDRELPFDLEIALGMPTNERMDALIEKATELGVAAIQPLQTERSVLRLDGDRAAKRVRALAGGGRRARASRAGARACPWWRRCAALAAWLGDAGRAAPSCAGRFVMSTGTAPRADAGVLARAPRAAAGWRSAAPKAA